MAAIGYCKSCGSYRSTLWEWEGELRCARCTLDALAADGTIKEVVTK